jgi:hypothetical protein
MFSIFKIIMPFDHSQNSQRKFAISYLFLTEDYIEVLLFYSKMDNAQFDQNMIRYIASTTTTTT